MDNNTMQMLARFKIMARRLGGFNVDIFRMVGDPVYAREMLARGQEVDSENLIVMALELSEALGLLDQPVANGKSEKVKPVVEVAEVVETAETGKDRYVFGMR